MKVCKNKQGLAKKKILFAVVIKITPNLKLDIIFTTKSNNK